MELRSQQKERKAESQQMKGEAWPTHTNISIG